MLTEEQKRFRELMEEYSESQYQKIQEELAKQTENYKQALLSRKDQEQQQEDWDHNHLKRMPDHFFIVERKSADDILIAVSEDNQMYWTVPTNNVDGKWEKLPDLPQD
jgi:isocitrate dehydrogenase